MLEKPINQSTNNEIKFILDTAWIKKRIIIYLQLFGFLENPECFHTYPDDSTLSDALKHLKITLNITGNLGVDNVTLNRFAQLYHTDTTRSFLPRIFLSAGIKYDRAEILFVAYKRELELELYVRPFGSIDAYTLIKTFTITSSNVSTLKPKMQQGDGLVPDGIYKLHFFPSFRWSDFYLAFLISYPNKADLTRREFWEAGGTPGGAINFHGCCVSIGCIPIGNPAIEEVFLFVRKNWNNGNIQFVIFPFKFDAEENMELLEETRERNARLADFWEGLRSIYMYLNEYLKLPEYAIDERGYYSLVQ